MARDINKPTSSRQYRYFGQDIILTRMHYVNDATSNRAEVEKAARLVNGYSIVARMRDRDNLVKYRYVELCGTVTDEPRNLEHALLEVATRLNAGTYCTITTPSGSHYYAITETNGARWGREHAAAIN